MQSQSEVSTLKVCGLTLIIGSYQGDLYLAKLFIHHYLEKHGYSVKELGAGSGILTLDSKTHIYSSPGIEISTLLKWIPKKIDDFKPYKYSRVKADRSSDKYKEPHNNIGSSDAIASCTII